MGNISYYTEKGLKELIDKLAKLEDVERLDIPPLLMQG